jgi:mono/diheme cytochrome c family protein
MRGHEVFQVRCAVCHYDRQSGPLHGPSLLGVFKKPALPSGAPANDERVTATVMHGRNMMPALGNTVDGQDLDDLLAYLHTL